MSADICSRVRNAAFIAALMLLLPTAGPTSQASAQVAFHHAPENLRAGEPVNLFVEVGGSEKIDGFVVALPASWSLEFLRVVDENGRRVRVTTEPLVEYANRWLILADGALRPTSRLVLTVRPVSPTASSTAAVTPVRLDRSGSAGEPRVLENLRSRAELPVVPVFENSLGRSADFSRLNRERSGAGLLVPLDESMWQETWNAFTVETWMKTTAFEQVVLSTWTGNDGDPYPIELMVDGSGHIVAYQGTEDHHVSMRSPTPVADGLWHHVAVVHDTSAGWTRLVVDGERADSLVHRGRMTFRPPNGIALGYRADDDTESSGSAYTGLLDEFRLLPGARSSDELRYSGIGDSRTITAGGIRIGFDTPEDTPNIPVRKDTPFQQRGIADLEVSSAAGGVTISWTVVSTDAVGYNVERSSDGLHYHSAGRVDAIGSTDTYSLSDPAPGDGVMFYRVREVLPDGEERVSDAVKVGMGETGEELTAILTGSFPNPFNPTTRISYTVRETQHVRLSVWDLSGQQVSMLVDENVSPGYHEVSFNAEGLPSGTYFVRLITPEGTQTHQMVLMK